MIQLGDLSQALSGVGVSPGDTVLLQSDLMRCGPINIKVLSREDILEFYLKELQSYLGAEGTLVVLTAYGDYLRYGKAYDKKESPSLSGVFSEYVRTRPGAVRSAHPVLSLTAIGAKAREICDGDHFDGFGYASPWGRIHRLNAKLVTLGYGIAPHGMTFLHYLENLYGVPYQYNKYADFPVLDDGEIIPGVFTTPVRYLDFGIDYDQTRFKQRLVDKDLARVLSFGRGVILGTDCDSVVAEGCKALAEDRYTFLVQPPAFREGEIPYDLVHHKK